MASPPQILDCTLRDGGYINQWRFEPSLAREVYRALSKGGVDIVEIGFRGTDRDFDPAKYGPWRFSPEELIRQTVRGIDGARLALMADFGKIEPGDFPPADESLVFLVRVAAHKHNLPASIKLLSDIKGRGYQVSLNAMGYSNFSSDERRELAARIQDSDLDYIYVADSYGSIFPDQMRELFEPLLELEGIKLGFHPHNSLQMAFANTLEAINLGVHVVDTTIYGMGRGAGNLPTEILLSYLQDRWKDRFNAVPVLNAIDHYFIPLHQKFGWGYQLPYMLSGIFRCHPSYVKTLVDQREYTIEDIWKAIKVVHRQNPVGFQPAILEDIIQGGLLGHGLHTGNNASKAEIKSAGSGPKTVPYLNRHEGRDFLVLANGPSLDSYQGQIRRFIDRYDPVVMGANNLSGLFEPHYHAFNNKRRFIDYVKTVATASTLLLSQYFSPQMIREYTSRDYETIFYRDELDAPFDIDEGVIQANCRTISVLLLAIAIAMGARRIFCAGLDGYSGLPEGGGSLYYQENDEPMQRDILAERHRWNQAFIEQIDAYLANRGQEGVHILTPTSYSAFYKGIQNYL